MILDVPIPQGKYCTGCPFGLSIPIPDKMHLWGYGCSYLHDKCKSGGDYDTYAIKNKKCPSLKEIEK
jgi:hypothetical protein